MNYPSREWVCPKCKSTAAACSHGAGGQWEFVQRPALVAKSLIPSSF